MCLIDLCANGFWFCHDCERVRGVSVDGIATACQECGSYRVKWNEPVQGFAESLQLAANVFPQTFLLEGIKSASVAASKHDMHGELIP